LINNTAIFHSNSYGGDIFNFNLTTNNDLKNLRLLNSNLGYNISNITDEINKEINLEFINESDNTK
jgi:hypothetical protein